MYGVLLLYKVGHKLDFVASMNHSGLSLLEDDGRAGYPCYLCEWADSGEDSNAWAWE